MATAGKQWGWENKTNIRKLCYRGTWVRSLYFRLFGSVLQLLLMEVLWTRYSRPHNQLRRINEGHLPLGPARGWYWVHCQMGRGGRWVYDDYQAWTILIPLFSQQQKSTLQVQIILPHLIILTTISMMTPRYIITLILHELWIFNWVNIDNHHWHCSKIGMASAGKQWWS